MHSFNLNPFGFQNEDQSSYSFNLSPEKNSFYFFNFGVYTAYCNIFESGNIIPQMSFQQNLENFEHNYHESLKPISQNTVFSDRRSENSSKNQTLNFLNQVEYSVKKQTQNSYVNVITLHQILNVKTQVNSIVVRKKTKITKRRNKYEPIQKSNDVNCFQRSSATKNVIKNFTRAMLTLILKDKTFSNRVLNHLSIEYESFYNYVSENREKVDIILKLKSMWIQQDNKYAKVMRILSQNFLRKHSMSHIFISKINNVDRNLKYMQSLLKNVKNLQEFRIIKKI